MPACLGAHLPKAYFSTALGPIHEPNKSSRSFAWQRSRILFYYVLMFGVFYRSFRVKRGSKMILSHMAPSCLDMSPYRAIWTYLRQHFIILSWFLQDFSAPTIRVTFLICRSLHLAMLMIFWDTWEAGSQTVSMEEPNLSIIHGNVGPVMNQAVQKLVPRGGL